MSKIRSGELNYLGAQHFKKTFKTVLRGVLLVKNHVFSTIVKVIMPSTNRLLDVGKNLHTL